MLLSLTLLVAICLLTDVVVALPIVAKVAKDDPKDDTMELVYVTAVWRHGMRSPDVNFTDNLYPVDYWPNGMGELTDYGIEQQRQLGSYIRQKYIKKLKLFSPVYSPEAYKVEASIRNRTQQSALYNFQGTFNDNSVTINDFDLTWPKENEENIVGYPYYNQCDFVAKLAKYAEANAVYQDFIHHNKWFKNLTTTTSILHSFDFADPLYVEKMQNLTLAPEYESAWEEIFNSYVTSLKYFYGDGLLDNKIDIYQKLVQYHAGRVLTDIMQKFTLKQQCSQESNHLADDDICDELYDLKFKAFSLHDTYITGSLFALGFKKLDYDRENNCEMASALFFELWNDKKAEEFYVKVIYRRNADVIFDITNEIEFCDGGRKGCKLEIFISGLKPFQITDSEEYCAQSL
ncbi:unnamed protein product [Bursaphelenchus okinawaensis]|uniref:acid phosphatase n=1 Tax=Bursaphelenchus okinawaensis TaxID=465554 RepID=A0A811L878_9BILA|nr:unnamed protein product [Bursaphelenchus okinawaensis]CAG9117608.1 unnamed protein product [Bursaphelenchus okinawaensis]